MREFSELLPFLSLIYRYLENIKIKTHSIPHCMGILIKGRTKQRRRKNGYGSKSYLKSKEFQLTLNTIQLWKVEFSGSKLPAFTLKHSFKLQQRRTSKCYFWGDFNGFLDDRSALTWCCPGNRSLVLEWLCDGTSCRERCRGRSRWAGKRGENREWSWCISCPIPIHFKSGHFVAQSLNVVARLSFPLCQTERKIPWSPNRGKADGAGTNGTSHSHT